MPQNRGKILQNSHEIGVKYHKMGARCSDMDRNRPETLGNGVKQARNDEKMPENEYIV